MSVADLHPEDLLDREASGTLTEAERALLHAHVAHCAACRLERRVRADFAAELDTALPAHDGSLFVMRALERTDEPKHAEPEAPPGGPQMPLPKVSRRLRAVVLAAAALSLAGAAGAARVTGVWSIFSPPSSASTPVMARPQATSAPLRSGAPGGTASALAVAPAPPPPPDPTVAAPTQRVAGDSPRAGRSAGDRFHAGDDPNGAGAVFARATTARREGDHARAVRLYGDLLRDHPDAAEASAARVALARLLLDDGDAEGALRYFDAYLRGGDGALREEAMAGRSRALARLGRDGEEGAAWAALLQAYPQSIHADRARARIEELGHR
jgi:hypothetical protein